MENRVVTGQNVLRTEPPQLPGVYRKGTLNRRPRLLFLSYLFPPINTSACARTWNIAKYLSRFGWEVTVVTPHPSIWRHTDNCKQTEANLKQEGIRCILTGHSWRCLTPDHLNCWNQGLGWVAGGLLRNITRRLGVPSEIGWIKAAEQACSTLTEKDVDIILVSGPPFVPFRLAKRLSDRLSCPYVLDYRDLWSKNAHDPMPSVTKREAKLVAGAAALATVSPSWASVMDKHFGPGPKMHVITNGYDPEELENVGPYEFGHFAIIYTGNFYSPKRVISPVMAALKRLKDTMNGKGPEWYFHYYGEHENHVREEAARFGVMERIVLHGRVSRSDALSAVRGAGVDVVITSVAEEATEEDKGIVTGKVYEAMGLHTPVLMIAPSESDARAITETSGLGRSFTGRDTDGIGSFLSEAMDDWVLRSKNLESYAWPKIAKKFDAILRKAVDGNSTIETRDYLDYHSEQTD